MLAPALLQTPPFLPLRPTLSFAVLFDVARGARTRSVMKRAVASPHGMMDVRPHFARFSDERPGRHNGIV